MGDGFELQKLIFSPFFCSSFCMVTSWLEVFRHEVAVACNVAQVFVTERFVPGAHFAAGAGVWEEVGCGKRVTWESGSGLCRDAVC